MRLDPAEMQATDTYQWMISVISPRPIAWVSTISPKGITNLAPFSFFQGITPNPPTVMFCPVSNREGKKKDTLRNIELVPEFVINIVSYKLAEAMNQSSAMLPYGVSEFASAGVTPMASERVRPPRVTESPVSLECRLQQIVQIGEGPLAANVIFGTIVLMHIKDDVLDGSGAIDPGKLDAIARMGGEDYARTTDRFTLARPGR